jgi:hypothetical protein
MKSGITWTITAGVLAITVVHLCEVTRAAGAQASRDVAWSERTSWGDPDLQGEWTSEGEYGVPFERPSEFGTRQFLTDGEYAKRLEEVRLRDERDLAPVDVLSGKVDAPNAPIPHWREYNTTSRRTSLIIDPPDGRLPPRAPQAKPLVPQRCGSLQRGEPCDSYEDYSLGVRCIVHGGGFPDAMFPAVYNANMRIIQSQGYVVITYELIHDTRVIPLDSSAQTRELPSPAIRMYLGAARGRWDGTTLVVESGNFRAKHTRDVSWPPADRAIHSHWARHNSVSSHLHRSGDVDCAMDRRTRPEGAARRLRSVRVRMPRRQLRDAQHALRVATP